MRIAMIGQFGLKPKGTMAVRALPLAKALTRRGHQVMLILPPWSYPQDAGRVWDDEGVRVENVTIAPRAAIPFRLIQRARSFHPDVIHIFKPKAYAGLAQWLVWQMRRAGAKHARIILDADDWEGAGGWNELERYSPAQKKYFAWQEGWGLRHADAITVASRALETIVWSLGAPREKVHYIPNGALIRETGANRRESVREKLALGDDPVALLYTRFFEFRVERVVDIFARILDRVPRAHLLIVGKGLFGEEKKLLELTLARDWNTRVHNAGWVEPEQLRGYFAAANIALYPFDDTLVNRCKCAVKLIDLLAAGVPVVAEAVGQNREYIAHGESGLLVAPGITDEFANVAANLLNDSSLQKRLGACAAETMAREYNWDVLAERAEQAYCV